MNEHVQLELENYKELTNRIEKLEKIQSENLVEIIINESYWSNSTIDVYTKDEAVILLCDQLKKQAKEFQELKKKYASLSEPNPEPETKPTITKHRWQFWK